MRDHSSRKYKKGKVTRFRTKSSQRVIRPQQIQRFRASQLPKNSFK